MKKETDGLEEIIQSYMTYGVVDYRQHSKISTTKAEKGFEKNVSNLASAIHTYISERLPPENNDYHSETQIDLGHKEGWNACLKSVREALGVDK